MKVEPVKFGIRKEKNILKNFGTKQGKSWYTKKSLKNYRYTVPIIFYPSHFYVYHCYLTSVVTLLSVTKRYNFENEKL
jgi:hypothetical protein